MYKYRRMTPEQRVEVVQQRRAMDYPSHAPPHPFRFEGYYFITGVNFEHKHLMADPKRRQEFASRVLDALSDMGCQLNAWVFLKNHYHWLGKVLDFEAMSMAIGKLHGAASRAWNLEDETPRRKCWYRYADRYIRNERHYWACLNYIHYNPVKHYDDVVSPYDWAESSVHWYFAEQGRQWLRDMWGNYPIKAMGKDWDNY